MDHLLRNLALVVAATLLGPATIAESLEREVQQARQRYRFDFLAAQPAVTGLDGEYAQALYIGARVNNRGANPELDRMTVLADVRLEERTQFKSRAHVSVKGIKARSKGVVFFPVPLPDEIDPRRMPDIKRVSIQVETNPSPREKGTKFVEFGAEPSPGFYLASVDLASPDAPVMYLDGRETHAGGKKGRVIRNEIRFWSTPGTAAAKADDGGVHAQPVRVTESKRGWRKVRTFTGEEGWLPEMLFSRARPGGGGETVVKVRNYGSFRYVDYAVVPSQDGGTVVEGRMLNDTANHYLSVGFEVALRDARGRTIAATQTKIKDFGRREIAPFTSIFQDIPSYQVARVKFKLKDIERRTDVIVIDGQQTR